MNPLDKRRADVMLATSPPALTTTASVEHIMADYTDRLSDIVVQARFWSKAEVGRDSECWEWRGSKTVSGYGNFQIDRIHVRAHRLALSYKLRRQVGDDMVVLHLCDNPSCVNPAHLREGTSRENTRDMMAKGRANFVGAKCGTLNPNAKLNWEKVSEIRSLPLTYAVLAARFGVRGNTIKAIKLGKTWRVSEPPQ